MTNNVSSGPDATPHNDGVSNLMKYLCDIDPSRPMTPADRAALPVLGTITITGVNYLTLTYRQYALATNIFIIIQASPDLQNWQPAESSMSQSVGIDPVTGDPVIEIRAAVTGNNQYLRLIVHDP
jgi:hypothetical protein